MFSLPHTGARLSWFLLVFVLTSAHGFVFKNHQSHRSSPFFNAHRNSKGSSRAMVFDPNSFLDEIAARDFDLPATMETYKYIIPLSLASAFAVTRAPSQLANKSTIDLIVENTYLQQRKDSLQCVYKASRDGWSAISFHEAVDGRGSGVVVARGISGQTFGGFNPNGWRSTDDYYSSSSSFLWCLKGKKLVKLPVLAGGNCAVFDYATSGPCFGSADFVIGPAQAAIMGGFAGPDTEDMTKSAGSLRSCRSNVGSTYKWDQAWPVRGSVRLVDVEVYCASNEL